MVKINIYIKIKCPDYGELEIKKYIPFNSLAEFQKLQLDLDKAFKTLIGSLIREESFDLSRLTEKDLDYIAQEIAKLNEVESQYLNSRKIGIPRSESLSGVLKENPKVKGIEERFKDLIKPLSERIVIKTSGYERLFEPLLRSERMIKEMAGVQSRFQEMIKELGGISDAQKSLEGIMGIEKTLGGIAGTVKVFEGLSVGKIVGDQILKNSLELQKISQSVVPKLSISETLGQVYQSRMTELVQNIDSIGKALKPVSGLLSITQETFRSFETIGEKISTFAEPIKLTNSALIKSAEIVSGVNNYFSRIDDLIFKTPSPGLPKELIGYEEELVENNEGAEELLHFEAGESISLSNKLASALETQIKGVKTEVRDLRNEVKKYEPLLTRMNILSNPPSILEFLKRTVRALSEKYWEIFWVKKGNKFVSRPERLIKSHLGLGIELGFGDIAFVGPEIKIGNGYIDLFINFLGTSYIIEFKIVGPGWGIGWVKSGLNQLDNYMNIHGRDESYLVVLDGRKTDRGEQLDNEYDCEHGKVYVITSKIFW